MHDKFGFVYSAKDNGHSFHSVNINIDAEEKTTAETNKKINSL